MFIAHIILKIYKYLFSNMVYANQTQYSNENLNDESLTVAAKNVC